MAVHRQSRMQRFLSPVVFAGLGAGAVFLIVLTARGDGPPIWFALAWLAALGWNAYWWLLRMCVEIEVDGPTLRWRTPLRRDSVPVSAIRAVRPSGFGAQIALIEVDGAPALHLPVRYGFAGLTRDIAAAAPHADVRGA